MKSVKGPVSYICLYIEGENMKKLKIWVSASFLAMMGLVACGDDDSSSVAVDDVSNTEVIDEEDSSESKTSSSSVQESSNSKKESSSSAQVSSSGKKESSSSAQESSSSKKESSSSVQESSSSKKESSSSVQESSSSKKESSSSVQESSSSKEESSSSEQVSSSSEEVSSSSVEESSSSVEMIVCGERLYDASEFFCKNGQAIELHKCGEKQTRYNPLTQLCDSRDSKVYRHAVFTSPEVSMVFWMAENLNYEVAGRSRCFNDSTKYCDKYGQLYTWATAVGKSESECGYEHVCNLPDKTIQGVCPPGWHLPSKKEWEDLFESVGGLENAGKALKSKTEWLASQYDGSDGNGDDTFLFTAYPAGKCNSSDVCYKLGEQAPFWTTEEDAANGSLYAGFYNHSDYGNVSDPAMKDDYLAVRCVQDY